MSKLFLTTGKKRKVKRAPKPKEPDLKYFDYQDTVTKHLKSFGMKTYWAQLATIDFKQLLFDSFRDKETTDVVAVRVLIKAKKGYGNSKIMITDGPCIYSGTE